MASPVPGRRSAEYGGGVDEGVVAVPIFLVERRFAEDLEASAEINDRINRINEEEGVRWLYSFLSADKRKTYRLPSRPGTRPGRPRRSRPATVPGT
jgi:hypothetical protein